MLEVYGRLEPTELHVHTLCRHAIQEAVRVQASRERDATFGLNASRYYSKDWFTRGNVERFSLSVVAENSEAFDQRDITMVIAAFEQ
jgi:hypothetical protein